MHFPIDRITHTTDFVTPVVEYWLERKSSLLICQWFDVPLMEHWPEGDIAQWVHHKGSIW